MPRYLTVPLARLTGELRQCHECAAQYAEGRGSDEADTWWFFGHPRTHVCPAHQAAWRRRRAWFYRCRELGCPQVEVVAGVEPPLYTCQQETCSLRRWPWRRSGEDRHG